MKSSDLIQVQQRSNTHNVPGRCVRVDEMSKAEFVAQCKKSLRMCE